MLKIFFWSWVNTGMEYHVHISSPNMTKMVWLIKKWQRTDSIYIHKQSIKLSKKYFPYSQTLTLYNIPDYFFSNDVQRRIRMVITKYGSFYKNIRQIELHICTRTLNKPISNLSIRHQSIHSCMMFIILYLVTISYNKCWL